MKFAVIEKNKCNFSQMREFALPLLYKNHSEENRKELKNKINEYIWSEISPYVKIIEIDTEDDFITSVCESLVSNSDEQKDDYFYHTEASYSFPKRFIELIYCRQINNKVNDIDVINSIGCLFSLSHTVIINNCVVIANEYNMEGKNSVSLFPIEKEDLIRVIRRRYFFTAILITPDNQLIKYYYQNLEYLLRTIFDLPTAKLSFSHLKYNLTCYFAEHISLPVNPIATRIVGSRRIFGKALFIHELEDNIYANLSIREIKRLNVLSYGKMENRELQEEEVNYETVMEVDSNGNSKRIKKTPYWSRYLIINNRMKKWKENKNRCMNCSLLSNKIITCTECYRAIYCSGRCKIEHENYHKEDCLKTIRIR